MLTMKAYCDDDGNAKELRVYPPKNKSPAVGETVHIIAGYRNKKDLGLWTVTRISEHGRCTLVPAVTQMALF